MGDEELGAIMVHAKAKLCLCFIALMLLQSCASSPYWICTYNGVKFKTEAIYRPFVGMCEYKEGRWGNWLSNSKLRYVAEESISGFTITYFNKYSQPSDFEFKIIAKKCTGTEGQWQIYQGEFIVKKILEKNISTHYTEPKLGISALKETWSFPCIIERLKSTLPEDKYIYPQLPPTLKYTLVVSYNGVGRAFTIQGAWIRADEYDMWE